MVRNAYSSGSFMSRQLYCMKFSYEMGSRCIWVDVIDGMIKLLGARGSIYCDQH